MPYAHDAYVMNGNTVVATYDGATARNSAVSHLFSQNLPYFELTVICKDDNGNWCSVVGPRPKNPPF